MKEEECHAIQESYIPGTMLVFDPLEDPAADPEEGEMNSVQLVPEPRTNSLLIHI